MDGMLEGCQIIGFDWRYRYMNRTAEQHSRQPATNLLGRTMMECWPGITETAFFTLAKSCMEQRLNHTLDNEFTFPDGTVGWFRLIIQPVTEGIAIFSDDITDRKHSEQYLRASLEEKVALLKEVHHRVKNNLQIVASLLSLQESRAANPEITPVLQDTRNRVRSMALLHEVLYRSENLARINFAAYVRELTAQLIQVSGSAAGRVAIVCRVPELGLPMEQAVPCGLIINELVSNALKHAFPGERPGTITITLNVTDCRQVSLHIRDDGTGLPNGFCLERSTTLGLQLVDNLTGQLAGTLTAESSLEGGSHFTIQFPLPGESTSGGTV